MRQTLPKLEIYVFIRRETAVSYAVTLERAEDSDLRSRNHRARLRLGTDLSREAKCVCRKGVVMPGDKFLKEKENYILHLLEIRQRVSVSELCEIFSMAPSSIRKRLAEMEKRGLLIRSHGGAVSIDANRDDSLAVKFAVNTEAKKAIARAAIEFVKPGDVIAVGGGTTTLELCALLASARNIIVLTNSITAANALMENGNIETRICSGIIRSRIGCIVGPSASSFFAGARANKTFLGVDALSIERGVSSSNILVGEVERSMAHCAEEVFILGDHSKMNKEVISPFLTLREVDYVVSDAAMPREYVTRLEQSGPRVILAPSLPALSAHPTP